MKHNHCKIMGRPSTYKVGLTRDTSIFRMNLRKQVRENSMRMM
jgi:hypothetical protein